MPLCTRKENKLFMIYVSYLSGNNSPGWPLVCTILSPLTSTTHRSLAQHVGNSEKLFIDTIQSYNPQQRVLKLKIIPIKHLPTWIYYICKILCSFHGFWVSLQLEIFICNMWSLVIINSQYFTYDLGYSFTLDYS